MITYNGLTYLDVIDKVIYRLNKHREVENISHSFLLDMVNRSVQAVYCKILPYKDWALRTQISISNGQWLSENLMGIERVMVSSTAAPQMKEARKATPQEFYTVTAQNGWQIWNRATTDRPIYCIYGNNIYIAPTITPVNGDPTDATVTGMTGILDCYMAPNNNITFFNNIPIPAEFEEHLILEAMQRVLFKTSDKAQLYTIIGHLNNVEELSMNTYMQHKITAKQTLEDFVSQDETPFRPPSTVPGALPKRLI